jgi:ParB/Sulfiredoxin domain
VKIRVADLCPNPFRDTKHYPIDPAKVTALVRSIKETSFWDNLLARKANGHGYELAYGVHRLEALKKAGIKDIDIPVRDLDDTTMMQIMANENMEEWDHSAINEQETVRAVIMGYGEGRIKLPKPTGSSLRFAPSYLPGKSGDYPYSIDTLTAFLGWKGYKVQAAINALSLVEQNVAKPEVFEGLSSRQAKAVADETTRVLKETNDPKIAASVARGLSAGFRKADDKKMPGDKSAAGVTIHSARRIANDLSGRSLHPVQKKLPNFEKFIDSIAKATGWYFENKREQWQAVVHFREEMPADHRKRLVAALKSLVKQAERMIEKLEG